MQNIKKSQKISMKNKSKTDRKKNTIDVKKPKKFRIFKVSTFHH